MNSRILVIAVALISCVSVSVIICCHGIALHRVAVAILINSVVTDIYCPGMNIGRSIVTVALGFCVAVSVRVIIFFYDTPEVFAVAILINAVSADFFYTRAECRINVIAVALIFAVTVSVIVHISGIAGRIITVTILIYTVPADFIRAGINRRIELIAVSLNTRETVIVRIFRSTGKVCAATVLINAVFAEIRSSRMDSGIVIVAVSLPYCIAVSVRIGIVSGFPKYRSQGDFFQFVPYFPKSGYFFGYAFIQQCFLSLQSSFKPCDLSGIFSALIVFSEQSLNRIIQIRISHSFLRCPEAFIAVSLS